MVKCVVLILLCVVTSLVSSSLTETSYVQFCQAPLPEIYLLDLRKISIVSYYFEHLTNVASATLLLQYFLQKQLEDL